MNKKQLLVLSLVVLTCACEPKKPTMQQQNKSVEQDNSSGDCCETKKAPPAPQVTPQIDPQTAKQETPQSPASETVQKPVIETPVQQPQETVATPEVKVEKPQ